MISIPSPRGKRRARIEIIPLIDIVFFLLATFVMVSLSMVKNQGIPVNLPVASTGAPQARSESVTVTVSEDGTIFLNKQQVAPDHLESALLDLVSHDSDLRVTINGDSKAEFGRAIAVLDATRKAGIAKVAIQTQPIKSAATKP